MLLKTFWDLQLEGERVEHLVGFDNKTGGFVANGLHLKECRALF